MNAPGRWPGAFFCALLTILATSCGEPAYHPAGSLDRKPYPLAQIDPEYPAIAGAAQYYGRLRMNVYISAEGAVDRVEVVESRVPEAFRDAAVQAFARSRWEPGVIGERKVPSIKVVEVAFEPPAGVDRPAMKPES